MMVAAEGRVGDVTKGIARRSLGRSGLWLVALLALTFTVQCLLAPAVRFGSDLAVYSSWGNLTRFHFLHPYSLGGQSSNVWTVPEYPPLVMYLFATVETVYFGIGRLLGLHLSHELVGSYLLVLKLPVIVFHTVTVGIMWTIARRLMPVWIATLALLTYALNPAILIDVLVWGQTDDLTLLLAIAALLLVSKHRGLAAGVVMGLMVVFKPQPLIFVPLALVYLLRWAGWREVVKAAAGLVAVAALLWLPYLVPPHPEILAWRDNAARVVQAGGSQAARTAFNLWSLVGGQQIEVSRPLIGPLNAQVIGTCLFGAVMVLALIGIWRSPSQGTLWSAAALVALAFFDVEVFQFERYVLPAIGLFLLAALFDRRHWPIFAAISASACVNMLVMVARLSNGALFGMVQGSAVASPTAAVVLSWANLAALLLAVLFFLTMSRPAGMAATADGSAPSMKAIEADNGQSPQGGSAQGSLKRRHLTREPYISVVIPCYNEEGNIRAMHQRLTGMLAPMTPSYELIFVNNGSYDGSAAIFDEIAAADRHVSIVTLSRNFGSQGAYTSGLEYASGDCVVCIDGDIQDPPEMIRDFVAKWLEGYDVVYGIRARRKGSLFRRIGYKAFYRLLQRVSYIDIPLDAGDFGLMDRRVVDVINSMPERNRLIRGLRAWAGFHQTGIPYVREERFSGRTTNSIIALFRWANLGLVSFSFAPLDLISYLAAGVVALTAAALLVYSALYFIVPNAPRGFQTLLVVVLFLGAVQLLCLSIIGSYLARMFEEIKARPKYLVQDIQNDHRHAADPERGSRAGAGAGQAVQDAPKFTEDAFPPLGEPASTASSFQRSE